MMFVNILNYNPELWLWLGDIVYADTRKAPFWWEASSLGLMEYKYVLLFKIIQKKTILYYFFNFLFSLLILYYL